MDTVEKEATLTERQTRAMRDLAHVVVGAVDVLATDWNEFDALTAEFKNKFEDASRWWRECEGETPF